MSATTGIITDLYMDDMMKSGSGPVEMGQDSIHSLRLRNWQSLKFPFDFDGGRLYASGPGPSGLSYGWWSFFSSFYSPTAYAQSDHVMCVRLTTLLFLPLWY